MNKRKIATVAVAALNACARLPGQRFYRLYLDEINRRFNDFGQATTVKAGGQTLRFVCPNQLTRWRVETIFAKEPDTIAWIDGFAPDSVVWDVGANVGIYSLNAAAARGCRVLAFEPAPANFALLAKNIEINGLSHLISAFPIALCDARRIGALSMRDTSPGSAQSDFGEPKPESVVNFDCLGYSADRFIADFDAPFPVHMKVDVDGAEHAVVSGAHSTSADPRLRSISIELDDRDPDTISLVDDRMVTMGFVLSGSFRSPLFATSPAKNYRYCRPAP
jgi:FkbM family methyltransferase